MKPLASLNCLLLVLFLAACGGAPRVSESAPGQVLLVYARLDASGVPVLVARPDLDSAPAALPLDFPAGCAVYNLYPSPDRLWVAVEFACSGGPFVQLYDPAAGALLTPLSEADSHFLAWSADGQFVYLQTDTYNSNSLARYELDGGRLEALSLPVGTYDLAALPDGDVLFSVTLGTGFGSEVRRGNARGGGERLVLAEPGHIVAYLRPSPDGSRVAYILIPDTQVPFPIGELWLMDSASGEARFLAEADAGHGYAPAWSPDGTRIAFVGRENPGDAQADLSAGALVSNVYLYDPSTDSLTALTDFPDAVVETPAWAPDGSALAFNVINDGTIHVWLFEAATGTLRQAGDEPSCCAVWLTGR